MSKDATLHLDELGYRALARFARGGDSSMTSALRTACLYYLADRDADRPAWPAPRLDTSFPRAPGTKVQLDCDTWRELAAEADRQDVSPEVLGVHALLYFLSDFVSGLVGRRLGDALDLTD
jgi:hypothetical protein